jgi:hypothetical protein
MIEHDTGSEYSTEAAFVHYESLADRQTALTGERFQEHLLIVHDRYYWSCTSFNTPGVINISPICLNEAANIPLTVDESSEIACNSKSGLIIKFTRKLPIK